MKNTCRVSQAINENEKPSNPRKAAKEDTQHTTDTERHANALNTNQPQSVATIAKAE